VIRSSTTKKNLKAAALAAVFSVSALGVADSAAPNVSLEPFKLDPTQGATRTVYDRWGSPAVFTADGWERDVRISLTQYYSAFRGRTLELREGMLTVAPSEKMMFWYAKQDVLAKGRSATNRFRTSADSIGARVMLSEPSDLRRIGNALQFEYYTTGLGHASTRTSDIWYPGTRTVTASYIHSRDEWDYKGSYTNIAAGGNRGHALGGSVGRSYELGSNLDGRLEGHLLVEHQRFTNGRNSWSARPYVSGTLNYAPASWLTLEGDLSVMPFGMPLAPGRLTGLTSFQMYNPGGVVAELRNNLVAVGSLRVMFHLRF
jgi:hypothetical protein